MNTRRFADYFSLTKPRIGFFVLVTVAVAAYVASRGSLNLALLLKTLFGTFLVAGGAGALNHLIEKEVDAKMKRTEQRPLPAGRLQPNQVLLFGLLLGVSGILWLAITVNALAGFLAFATLASYVFLYTPMKRRSTLNTVIGAVPGALPAVIGWAAAANQVWGVEAWLIFAIVFLWQFPHFLAIAWIYREDYENAGLRMLPVSDRDGQLTGFMMVGYCLALLPVSLMPSVFGLASSVYFFGALILGLVYLAFAIGFVISRSQLKARQLLRASLVYLPSLFALLVFDHAWI